VGLTCTNDGECNTGESCSLNQEDRDHDGAGDACDSDVMCKGNFDFDKDVDVLMLLSSKCISAEVPLIILAHLMDQHR